MGGEGHPVQGGHILALGAGGYDDNLVLGQALNGIQIHDGACLDLEISQLLGDLQHILHAPSGDGYLPAVALGSVQHCLNPVHIGGEGGDDDPLVTVAELPVKTFGNGVLAGGVAAALHVGGFGQQSQNPFVAQLSKTGKVDHAVGGGGVDLEVAGHHHGTHGGLDGESHRIGDGVVDVNELHTEAAGLHHLAGLVGDELHLVRQPVLLQLQLNQTVRHGGAVDGAIDLLHAVGDGADVILVTVGDEHTPELLLVGDQIGEVRDHQIHTVHILLGEAHAAVHHDHVLAVLQNGDVLADFIQSAQRNNFQFFCQLIYSPFVYGKPAPLPKMLRRRAECAHEKRATASPGRKALNRRFPEKRPQSMYPPVKSGLLGISRGKRLKLARVCPSRHHRR